MINLKDERKKNRYSQELLAKASGVSRITISRIESGKQDISMNVAKKIAPILNVKWTEFFE